MGCLRLKLAVPALVALEAHGCFHGYSWMLLASGVAIIIMSRRYNRHHGSRPPGPKETTIKLLT